MGPKPPPPPGPPPGPPPPPVFGGGSKGGSSDDRGALLSSIRQGTKLKKTVTVDKSGPIIPGKVSSVSSGASQGGNSPRSAAPLQNGGSGPPGLGGLFAGGMPKLRPTGKLAGSTPNGQVKSDAPRFPPPQPQQPPQKHSPDKSRPAMPPAPTGGSNVGALSAALSEALAGRDRDTREAREAPVRPVVRRQPSDIRTRGPPPQPPVQKPAMPLSSSDSVLTTNSVLDRISNLQQQVSEQAIAPHVASTLHRNKSSLHSTGPGALGGSMTSLSSPTPSTPSPASSLSTSDLCERPTRISHGKPNLAPKPPTLAPANDTRPSPPPKKLITNGKIAGRTQSMRVPRSPPASPSSPQTTGSRPFNLPPAPANPPIGTKNPASHFGTLRPTRVMRPPGVCPPPPPGAPPPPPPSRHVQPPPPPPPHHRLNSINGDEGVAPAPPVRGSSMRSMDLEARFAEFFNPPTSFPDPDPFMRIAKGYSSATVAVSKAQAPPPPLRVPLEGWSGTSSAC